MANAVLEKRVKALENEVRTLKTLVTRGGFGNTKQVGKKLPSWLRASLKDVEEGKVSGPFRSAKELMAHLER